MNSAVFFLFSHRFYILFEFKFVHKEMCHITLVMCIEIMTPKFSKEMIEIESYKFHNILASRENIKWNINYESMKKIKFWPYLSIK